MNINKKEKNQHINVFVRVRPLNKLEGLTNVIEIKSHRELCIKHHATAKSYTFDRVFGPESRQIELYKLVAEPTVSEVISGYNCTVLAYGQTGTGKTYTMAGGAVANVSTEQIKTPWFEDVHSGIIPRTLAHMFDELRMQQLEYTVRVSYLELYNEEIFDLLSPVDDNTKLKLYDDSLKKGSVIVQGLTECNVNNKAEVYRILEKGAEKRRIASTLMNSQSSRSHTVFCITVHTKENSVDGEDLLKTGKLYLVDLAGSENIKQSGASELRAREAFSINQSLLTLGRCIVKLMERSAHIPYRESKLTRLLQDSLGGRTKTTLIATVSPAFMNTDETMNTLEYAGRAKHITNKPEVNQRLSKTALLKEYTEEIERLRRDLNASRMGKGVYLDKDNYDSLVKERDAQKDEIAEKIGMIRVLQEEMDRKEETFNILKMTLVEHQKEVETKEIVIETLEKQIEQASKEIDELSHENSIKEYIVSKHCETEQVLQVTAKKLLDVAELTTADTEKLHDKLDAVMELNKHNKAVCEKYIADFNNKISVIENKLSDFHDRENVFHNSMSAIVKLLDAISKAFAINHVQFDEQMKSLLTDTSGLRINVLDEYGEFTNHIGQGMSTIKETVDSNETAIINRIRTEILPQMGQQMDRVSCFRKSVDIACNTMKDTLAGNLVSTTGFVVSLKDKIELAKQDTNTFIRERKTEISNFQDELISSLKFQEMEENEIEQKFTLAINLLNDAKAMSMEYIKRDKIQKINCLQNYEGISDSLSASQNRLNGFFDETSKTVDTLHTDVSHFTVGNSEHFGRLHAHMIDTGALIASKIVKVVDDVESASGFVEDANHSVRNSVNNNCDILVKKYTDAVETRQKKYDGLTDYTTSLKDEQLKNRAELFARFDSQVKQLSDELSIHGSYLSQHESHVSTELEQCREGFKKFFGGGIKDYKQTGVTPIRKRYRYPKQLLETKSHDQLVEEYYSSQSQSTRVSEDDDDINWNQQNNCSSPDRGPTESDIDGNRIEPLTENNMKKDQRSLIPRPGEKLFGNVNN